MKFKLGFFANQLSQIGVTISEGVDHLALIFAHLNPSTRSSHESFPAIEFENGDVLEVRR